MKVTADLEREDVMAIARSRVNRAEGSRQTYWMLGVVLTVAAGIILSKTNLWAGLVVALIGPGGFMWYLNKLGVRQKDAAMKLVQEWMKEEK